MPLGGLEDGYDDALGHLVLRRQVYRCREAGCETIPLRLSAKEDHQWLS